MRRGSATPTTSPIPPRRSPTVPATATWRKRSRTPCPAPPCWSRSPSRQQTSACCWGATSLNSTVVFFRQKGTRPMTTQSESLSRSPGLRALAAVTLCALLLAGCSGAGSQEQVQVQAPPPVSPEVIAVAEKAIGEGRYSDAKLLLGRGLLSEAGNPAPPVALAGGTEDHTEQPPSQK